MTKAEERGRFIEALRHEGVPEHVARLVCRHATTLTRIAELQCSSEAFDRDRVRCPGDYDDAGNCLCRDYGSYTTPSSVSYDPTRMGHGMIPRGNVTEYQRQQRIVAQLAPFGVTPVFQGDPRGAVVKLRVPSGRTDDWGQTGLCVP